jgi:PAS domain S-box-containing protein
LSNQVNILIVDDYPANLVALAAVLSEPIYKVFEANSGPEALQILEENEIALIMLDIQMPTMDGYEVARRIRANPRTREIPIIFITAVYREEPSVRKGYEAGGQDYIGKPFDPEVLKAKVGIYSNLFLKSAVHEKRARELAASEERYRLIVENVKEIIATIDTAGTVTSLNLAFERLTGLKSSDWVGKSFIPLVDPDDVVEVLAHFSEGTKPQSTGLLQTRIHTEDGRWIPVEISVRALDRNGPFPGTIGVIRDISERDAN